MDFEFLKLFSDEIFLYFLIACNTIAVIVWIITLVTGKHSFMDKLWPILPGTYAWAFLYTSLYFNSSQAGLTQVKTNITNSTGYSQYRLGFMTLVMTVWGARLAYYFWRRGYYRWDFEDHRWDLVKKRLNYPEKKIPFHIFNFIFMAFMQNWILIGYALPMWYIQTHRQEELNLLDAVVAVFYLISFTIEAVADEQQWNFQSKKYMWIDEQKSKVKSSEFSNEQIEDFKRGFLIRGLFQFCRHPNYFGDILLWWSIYAFSLSAQYSSLTSVFSLFNYSMWATLLMTYMFQRSVKVSEIITKSKYPEYTRYQDKVGRIFPSFTAYAPARKN